MGSCKGCKHRMDVASQERIGSGVSYCRRYPPQVVVSGHGEVTALFPPVLATMGCAEWAPGPSSTVPLAESQWPNLQR